MAGELSVDLIVVGGGTTIFGTLTGQPEIVAPGLALTSTGGALGILGGFVQIGSGVFQGAGGADYSNAINAVATLTFGVTLKRFIAGPPTAGFRTASQRTADALRRDTATVTGGTQDVFSSLIEQLGPQQKRCAR
jgi:Na+-driven multidrug efflux pump